MKKLLLSMTALLMAATPALAKDYSVKLTADTEYSAYVNSYEKSFTTTTADGTYEFTHFNNGTKDSPLACLRAGRKSSVSVATAATGFKIVSKVTSVKVNIETLTDANASKVVITLEKSLDNAEWTAIGTFTSAKGVQSVDVAAADQVENAYYRVKFDCQALANGFVRIDALTITAEDGGATKDPAGLAFDQTAVRTVKGGEFTAPVLANPNNLAVTWTSSNEEVATVNEAGVVTIVNPGKATITATSEATDKYFAGNASYELTVARKVSTVKNLVDLCNKDGDVAYVNCTTVAVYVNGNNCYISGLAGGSGALVFQKTDYKSGDIIPAGWYATAKLYNGLLEFTAEDLKESTMTDSPLYDKVQTVTEADVNKIVVLKGVTFAEATPERGEGNSKATNFTGKLADGSELTFRTNWDIASVPAGTYDVTGAVSIYKTTLQFYPIKYAEPVAMGDPSGLLSCEDPGVVIKYTVADPESLEETGFTVTGKTTAETVTLKINVFAPYNTWCTWAGPQMGGFALKAAPDTSDWVSKSILESEFGIKDFNKDLVIIVGEEGQVGVILGYDDMYDPANYVRVYYNIEKDESTGVEAIEAEGEAVYYDLQGNRVAEPENGIFVKVAGGKAVKVLL